MGEGPGLRPAARAPLGREGGGRPSRQRRPAPRVLGQLHLGRGPPDHEPPLRGRDPAGALDAAGQPVPGRLPGPHARRREEGGCFPHPGAARLPRRDAGGPRRGARRRLRPRALQGGRGAAEGPRGGVREKARHPLPVRRVRRGPLLHPHRVRGDQGRPARVRAAPRGRQLRGRDRQLELAAPHGRLLPAAGVQGRPAVPAALLLPRLDEGRPRGRRGGGARVPGAVVPLVDRRRDEGARGALVPRGARPLRGVDPDHGGGGRALAGGGDRGGRRPAGAREHAEERRGTDRGPAPRPDRREAAPGRRARARLGGEAAGRDARARGLRGPREAERGEARHLGPRLPARHGLPRAARPALAAHPRPPLDRGDEARRRAGDRLHGARPRAACGTSWSATRSATPRPWTGGSSDRG